MQNIRQKYFIMTYQDLVSFDSKCLLGIVGIKVFSIACGVNRYPVCHFWFRLVRDGTICKGEPVIENVISLSTN